MYSIGGLLRHCCNNTLITLVFVDNKDIGPIGNSTLVLIGNPAILF